MLVFVTGATGFIGGAVVPELLQAGHQVLAFVRSESSAAKLSNTAGVQILRGDIENLEVLKQGAQQADATIHLAFIHDFTNYAASAQKDLQAVRAISSVLIGSNKSFVIAGSSAITVFSGAKGRTDESVEPTSGAPRADADLLMAQLRSQNVHSSVVRLPPSVHGKGDGGFVALLMATAREKQVSVYVEEGQNVWPAVHREDAAVLFRQAIESRDSAAPVRILATAEHGIAFKDIAEAIGKKCGVPIKSIPASEAETHLGWLGRFAQLDNPVDSSQTRKAFEWRPRQVGLLEDIEAHY